MTSISSSVRSKHRERERVIPITVEDDDSDYQYSTSNHNNSSNNHNHHPKTPALRRVSPAQLAMDDNGSSSNVVDSFHHELDQLTKSFDVSVSHQSYSTAPHHSTSSNMKDPPPSSGQISPLRNYPHGTPISTSRKSRRPPSSSSSRHIPTPAEPPPIPIQSPPFSLFPSTATSSSSKATSSQRKQNQQQEQQQHRPEPIEAAPAVAAPLDPSLAANNNALTTSSNLEWEEALDTMRQTLQDKDERIRQLERENEDLRHRLSQTPRHRPEEPPPTMFKTREPPSTSYHRSPSPPAPSPPTYHDQSNFDREPLGRRAAPPPSMASSSYRSSLMSPQRGINSPPRRIRTSSNRSAMNGGYSTVGSTTGTTAFSPGTTFVAELSRLMQLEEGHHAPLSVILDKHWDKLQHHFQENQFTDSTSRR